MSPPIETEPRATTEDVLRFLRDTSQKRAEALIPYLENDVREFLDRRDKSAYQIANLITSLNEIHRLLIRAEALTEALPRQ